MRLRIAMQILDEGTLLMPATPGRRRSPLDTHLCKPVPGLAQPRRIAQRQAQHEHSRLTAQIHELQSPLGFGRRLQGVAELTDQLATPAVLRSMGSSVDSSRLRANTGWPRTTSSPKLTMYLGSSWHSRPKRSAWGWHKLYILLGQGAGQDTTVRAWLHVPSRLLVVYRGATRYAQEGPGIPLSCDLMSGNCRSSEPLVQGTACGELCLDEQGWCRHRLACLQRWPG